jgi:hypothetical protein
VLSAPTAVLDADAPEPARVRPGAKLRRGRAQLGQIAEDVAEAVAPPYAEMGRVGVGDVVVEADQRRGRAADAGPSSTGGGTVGFYAAVRVPTGRLPADQAAARAPPRTPRATWTSWSMRSLPR